MGYHGKWCQWGHRSAPPAARLVARAPRLGPPRLPSGGGAPTTAGRRRHRGGRPRVRRRARRSCSTTWRTPSRNGSARDPAGTCSGRSSPSGSSSSCSRSRTSRRQPDRTGLTAYRGQIVEIDATRTPRPDQGFEPNVRVRLVEGPQAGQVVDAYLEGPGGSLDISTYRPGDDVVVTFSRTADGQEFIAVSDRWRLPQLAGLAAVFALTVVIIGGWRGLRALIALGLTIAVVMRVLLPLLIEGVSPIPLAVAAATGVTIATIVLTEGWSRASVAAILGTATALALTGLLGAFVTQIGGFTGAAASDLIFLQTSAGGGLDLRGILLAAFILGSIGVLDDVTVTQAAFIDEVGMRAGLRGRELFASALDIGRSHIAATINTLFLAYVGATLPLLVVLIVSQQPALLVLNGETIAIEIVRTLVGSIGIVAAVPITSAIATVMVGAADRPRPRPPARRDDDRLDPPAGARRRAPAIPPPADRSAAGAARGAHPRRRRDRRRRRRARAARSDADRRPDGLRVAGRLAGGVRDRGLAGPREPLARCPRARRAPPTTSSRSPSRASPSTCSTRTVASAGSRSSSGRCRPGRPARRCTRRSSTRPTARGRWDPASWTILGGSGRESSAVSSTRDPSLEPTELVSGAATEGWIEAPGAGRRDRPLHRLSRRGRQRRLRDPAPVRPRATGR